MKYLFDTHTYLWFRGSPQLLPPKVLDILTDTSHEGYISLITPWEIGIKVGTGKLEAASLLQRFEEKETAAGFLFLPFTSAQGIASGLLPRHHRDPFDRMLVVQALDMRIPIVGRDRAFDLYGVQRIWD
jgi:PIN domain nuclease of toxin-antitoxin system